MKRFRWAIALLFVFFLQFAYADSITTFQLSRFTYVFGPDVGGGNAGYGFAGLGIYLTGEGSASCSLNFCFVGVSFSPGMSLVPGVFVDFESSQGYVTIGGHTYGDVTLFVSSITAGRFTFPAGGNVPSIFRVTVPASFGLVQGEVSNGTLFDVGVPPGKLVLTFNYYPASNGHPASYWFSKGQYEAQGIPPIPEPGTIGFMATGLAGIVGLMRRKRVIDHLKT